jgi:hypothetical protein
MNECEKMKMFVDDNFAMEYIIWENTILKQDNNDDITDIPDIDFDIID